MENFLIGIGAGKSGTTWLHSHLSAHPEIFGGAPKEINFFSELFSKKDVLWYEGFFKNARDEVRLDFSVSYMLDCCAAERINSFNPDSYILAILRHPLDRIYSDYLHSIRKGEIGPDAKFSRYASPRGRLEECFYGAQLRPYFKHFPREKILVLDFAQALKDPKECFARIFQWLPVRDASFCPENLKEAINVARSARFLWLENLIAQTSRTLNGAGYIRLTEAIKKSRLPEALRFLNSAGVSSPSRPDRVQLIASLEPEAKIALEEDARVLEGLIGEKFWSFEE